MATDAASSSSSVTGAGRPRASIATTGGEWFLGWDPTLGTFWATHRRHGADGAALASAPTHDLGTGPGACPSVGALQEALGFALGRPVRDALAADRAARPPLALPRSELHPDAATPRSLDTFPTWASQVAVLPDGDRGPYGLRLEQERPLGVAELGGGTRLEVLAGTPEAGTGAQRVEYRLTHDGRVVFAGDDVAAPADADLGADESLRALAGVLLDPDAPHRAHPLSPAQAAFVAAHGDRVRAALVASEHPFPAGTRVRALVDGDAHLGVVTYAATTRDRTPDGEIQRTLAYGWRPDAANLVGHPWRHEPTLALVAAPDALTPSLAPPFVAVPAAGQPLGFGAVVALAHPASGERVEGTVLRAFSDGDGFVYQVQPNDPALPEALTVADTDCALVTGAWWPTRQHQLAARRAAGIALAPGEVFGALDCDRPIGVAGSGPLQPPAVTPAEQRAALTVDAGPTPPDTLTISQHGQLTRVGDPTHGVLLVSTERWVAALRRDPAELHAALRTAAPDLRFAGEVPKVVLAALAAHHAPDALTASAPSVDVPRPRPELRAVEAGL